MADEVVVGDEGPVVLAMGLDAEALEEPVLLLAAMGLPYAIVPAQAGVALVVPPEHAEHARRELATLKHERVAPVAPPTLLGGARAGIPAAIALLLAHASLTLVTPARRAAIYAAGELDSAKLRAGQLHRAVTALTLHADLAHVVGNAAATAIFVSAAGDSIGPGVALLLTVVAGTLGNLGAALIDPGHHSIGFSTATFGALGLTAVLGFVARHRQKRAWLALGSGVALLALLGAGEKSDLLAHILGLLAGATLGFGVARRRPLERAGQLVAAVGAVVIVAAAWAAT